MAHNRICSIPDCGKPVKTRGYCPLHYHRLWRHGDPLANHRYDKKEPVICSIDGCEGRAIGRGYCSPHYQRLMRHGDPLGGGTPHGAVRRWLDSVAIAYTGDDCLPFPFSTDGSGYGRINLGGQYVGAHVYVAERCLGPRPTPKHEVCHSCGNGDEACVTKAHLYWGTRKENVQDAIAHGTFSKPPVGMRGKRKCKVST
jgi:hypothetical protein